MNSDELRSSFANSLTSPVSLPAANDGFEALVPHTNKNKKRSTVRLTSFGGAGNGT